MKSMAAARIMSGDPASLQLRFLQTVSEIAAENNSTTLFPIPMDLLAPFLKAKAALSAEELPGQEDEENEEVPELPSSDVVPGRLAAGEPVHVEKKKEG